MHLTFVSKLDMTLKPRFCCLTSAQLLFNFVATVSKDMGEQNRILKHDCGKPFIFGSYSKYHLGYYWFYFLSAWRP